MKKYDYYYAMYYTRDSFGKEGGGRVVENSLNKLKKSLKARLKEISANTYELDVYYEAMILTSYHTLLYRIIGKFENDRLYEKIRTRYSHDV